MKIPSKINSLYLSHGGGPLPLMGDQGHREMVESLRDIASKIEKPEAIVVVSAHWEEQIISITSGTKPPMIFDYYGFPKEAYEIEYSAPGSPELAEKIYRDLSSNGVQTTLDSERGFDHGLYVPLKLMYPDAEIPCIQVSLIKSLDAKAHIQMGELLTEACSDRVLLIGSGFSFHNMQAFQSNDPGVKDEQNEAFERWLIEVCSSREIDEESRVDTLVHWKNAPGARYCHPREEHLLPLHVCYGRSKQPCQAYQELTIIGKKASFYCW